MEPGSEVAWAPGTSLPSRSAMKRGRGSLRGSCGAPGESCSYMLSDAMTLSDGTSVLPHLIVSVPDDHTNEMLGGLSGIKREALLCGEPSLHHGESYLANGATWEDPNTPRQNCPSQPVNGSPVTRVAVMQPYFMPYAGYFRLFVDTDVLVLYDDVQFPKEGWVHRNKLAASNGELRWLTIPLKRTPLSTKINELVYARDAQTKWIDRMNKFPVLEEATSDLIDRVRDLGNSPISFLVKCLAATANALRFRLPVVRSSELSMAGGTAGQTRVLEIVEKLGGTEYVNLSGGRNLYKEADFRRRNLKLTFLPEYEGDMASMLQRLLTEDVADLRAEIIRNVAKAR